MMIVAIAHSTSRHTTSTTTTTGTAIAALFILLVIMVTVGMVTVGMVTGSVLSREVLVVTVCITVTVDVVEGCDVMIVAVLGVRITMVTIPLLPVVNLGVGNTVKITCVVNEGNV